MNIKGLWEYDEYRHAAEFHIAELEDRVAYLSQVISDANAEIDAKQRGIDFLRERNAILEKQVQKLTCELKDAQEGKGRWVYDVARHEWLPTDCAVNYVISRAGSPLYGNVLKLQKDENNVGMD